MSDTRAAIRELRLLSEKRSVGTLSEAELGRWVVLRQKLGLPLEVTAAGAAAVAIPPGPEDPLSPARAAPAFFSPLAPIPGAAGPAGGLSSPPAAPFSPAPADLPPVPALALHPADVAPVPPGPVPVEEAAAPSAAGPVGQPTEEVPVPPSEAWAGPSLDAPAAHSAGGRGAPGLEVPGWSSGLSERPTDPGLDEPPPAPFDEAPAARRPLTVEAADLEGRPDEPVPLAATAEFVSYAREGEGIELPSAAPAPEAPVQSELAELANAFGEPFPGGAAVTGAPFLEVPGAAPLPTMDFAPEPPLEPAAPQPLPAASPPEPAPEPAALEPEAPAGGAFPVAERGTVDEGAIPLTAAPLPLEVPAEATGFEPRELVSAAGDGVAPPPSTWAPGAVAPPALAADTFGQAGEPLTTAGLDPWPEPPPVEEGVETIGDEDLVHEAVTPTPLPIVPSPAPPGSGGIRGFQFPRPPGPMVVPVPPTSQVAARTLSSAAQPATSIPATSQAVARTRSSPAQPVASIPPTTAPRSPAPLRLKTPIPASAGPEPAAPPAPPSRDIPPGVLPRTPVPATGVAPVTPPPAAASRATARAIPASGAAPSASPAAPPGVLPRTPVPVPLGRIVTPSRPTAPPTLEPARAQDEGVLPLLELVDEVEPAPAQRPQPPRPVATPTPAGGTGVFGPPMVLNPGFVEGDHRVVIHTLEGQVHRGTVHNLDLQDDALAVQQPDGREVRIPARRVKAVFFVLAPGEAPPRARGERVQVTFRDGRQVVGHSEDHATGEPGFFVVPSDARTNTARVYVYRGGVQSITSG